MKSRVSAYSAFFMRVREEGMEAETRIAPQPLLKAAKVPYDKNIGNPCCVAF